MCKPFKNISNVYWDEVTEITFCMQIVPSWCAEIFSSPLKNHCDELIVNIPIKNLFLAALVSMQILNNSNSCCHT